MIAAVAGNGGCDEAGGCVRQDEGSKASNNKFFSLFQTLGLVGSWIWDVSWLGIENLL